MIKNHWIDRFKLLLQGRSYTAFANDVGTWSSRVSSTITRPNKPSWPFLEALVLIERADANWLLTGTGAPYRVYRPLTEEDLHAVLDHYLTDCQQGYILPSGQSALLLLERTVQLSPDNKRLGGGPVRNLELLYAPPAWAPSAIARLQAEQALELAVPPDTWQRLRDGLIGNVELVDPDSGLLHTSPAVVQADMSEPAGVYAQTQLSSDSEQLLARLQRLRPKARRALLTFLEAV